MFWQCFALGSIKKLMNQFRCNWLFCFVFCPLKFRILYNCALYNFVATHFRFWPPLHFPNTLKKARTNPQTDRMSKRYIGWIRYLYLVCNPPLYRRKQPSVASTFEFCPSWSWKCVSSWPHWYLGQAVMQNVIKIAEINFWPKKLAPKNGPKMT